MRKCGFFFNLALTILAFYHAFSLWLFEEASEATYNISEFTFLQASRNREAFFGIFHIIVTLFLGAFIVMLIWNKLLSGLFEKRKLGYGESYTFFILLSFLAALFR